MSLRVVTYGPNVLALDDVKRHLRLEHTTEHDDRLNDLIPVAETVIEDWTGRAIRQNTYAYAVPLPSSGVIRLPRPPVNDVSGVNAVDATGAPIPLSYQTILYAEPARVVVNQPYPLGVDTGVPVIVEFTCGYTSGVTLPRATAAPPLPAALLHGMRLLVGHYFEHTEAASDTGFGGGQAVVLPEGVEQIVFPYRLQGAVGYVGAT